MITQRAQKGSKIWHRGEGLNNHGGQKHQEISYCGEGLNPSTSAVFSAANFVHRFSAAASASWNRFSLSNKSFLRASISDLRASISVVSRVSSASASAVSLAFRVASSVSRRAHSASVFSTPASQTPEPPHPNTETLGQRVKFVLEKVSVLCWKTCQSCAGKRVNGGGQQKPGADELTLAIPSIATSRDREILMARERSFLSSPCENLGRILTRHTWASHFAVPACTRTVAVDLKRQKRSASPWLQARDRSHVIATT